MSIFNTKKYIAAVSGGPDSIALLHMYRRHIKAVCTVKYNKRPDCEKDVECVRTLCEKYKIKLEVLDVNEEMYNEIDINNFQAKARKIRYDFFKEIAVKYHAEAVLVAHQLDDFLETAYLQQQKSSMALFYGIMEYSDWNGLTIYRPLIRRYRKATLQRYCEDYDLPYAIDSSNEEDVYERNRVRKIISFWDTQKVHSFLKEIDTYNKEHAKLRKQIETYYKDWELMGFDIKFIKQLNELEQFYLIYEYLHQHGVVRTSRHKINGVIEFINGMNGKEYRLTDELVLIKQNKQLRICSLESENLIDNIEENN